MIRRIIFRLTLLFFTLTLVSCGLNQGDFIGVNSLSEEELTAIDEIVAAYRLNYEYINIALVEGGEVVLTKSYGQNRLNKKDVYASVSKPVTAMILLQLYDVGLIEDIEDDVGDYIPEYSNVLPEPYTKSEITFEQLLTHQSGVPHLTDLWKDGKLILDFEPGTAVQYSTNGYGILGAAMTEITGESYTKLVKTYIGEPVGASSFTSKPWFQAPGGQVRSTIHDMARFAIGVMDGSYASESLLQKLVYRQYADEAYGVLCLGWYCTNLGTTELALYHSGSNGRPRAFLAVQPYRGYAVAITGLNHDEGNPHDFGDLTIDLMEAMMDTFEAVEE